LLILQVGMGVNKRNENYNTPVLAELPERGKLISPDRISGSSVVSY